MYATGTKKMLNMMILEILRKHTDEKHFLTQQKIIEYLKKDYDMECDRRSVKSNVESLKEMGYDISMEKGYRLLSREFDDSELRILIDSVLFSKSISTKQAQELIEKIKNLASENFKSNAEYVSGLPELHHNIYKKAKYSLELINDAIAKKRKISFIYNEVGTDFKLHPKRKEPYIVNPYQIVANNGKFYLIANLDKYDDVSHFRIDKMTDVKILEEERKPMAKVKGLENGLNLPKHMAEHLYMFSGEGVPVKFRTPEWMMSELVDWFGRDFSVMENKDGNLLIRVICNEKAMRYWALQYGLHVEIIEPQSLRKQITEDIDEMQKKYSAKQN